MRRARASSRRCARAALSDSASHIGARQQRNTVGAPWRIDRMRLSPTCGARTWLLPDVLEHGHAFEGPGDLDTCGPKPDGSVVPGAYERCPGRRRPPCPASGCATPVSRFSMVVLPAPLGPTTPSASPWTRETLRSSTTSHAVPYDFVRFLASSITVTRPLLPMASEFCFSGSLLDGGSGQRWCRSPGWTGSGSCPQLCGPSRPSCRSTGRRRAG